MSHEGSSKGLNTESNNPQRASATMLVELRRNNTAEMDAQYYPGSGPSWRGKTPTSCFGGLYCLERLQVTELVELEVATMAKTLDLNQESNQESNPLLSSPPPPFIGVPVLIPPNILAGRDTT